jgi:hypothetical protein
VTTSRIIEADAPPPDALLCAMVLAPATYARNRFFKLFENAKYAHMRGRAKVLRGLIRELLGTGARQAEIIGTQILDDRVLLRIHVPGLSYERTTALSLLENALVNFAVARGRGTGVAAEDEELVHATLQGLGQALNLVPKF